MKEGNIDRQIREKLQEREIQPSASAWERLSSQLDDVEQKKRSPWFLYLGYAASIAVIVSLFFLWSQKDQDSSDSLEQEFVNEEVEIPKTDPIKEFNTVPVEDNAIVQNDNVDQQNIVKQNEKKQEKPNKFIPKKQKPSFKRVEENSAIANTDSKIVPEVDVENITKKLIQQDGTALATTDTPKENDSLFTKKNATNSGIFVDSDALLMSVTASRDELKAYYKKYKIDRAEVLLAIQKELKKSSLKVDPQTILAEVEQDVNEEDFQNNFYQFIKKRVSSVATAIANRNN